MVEVEDGVSKSGIVANAEVRQKRGESSMVCEHMSMT